MAFISPATDVISSSNPEQTKASSTYMEACFGIFSSLGNLTL
jgi:hypothetical protein